MLEANRISYRYRNKQWLFKHLSIEVKPGEVVGISGRSGIGKTTMAKILSGYLKPSEGTVKVDGRAYPIKKNQPVQLVWQHPEKVINPRWRMKKVLLEAGPLDEVLLSELGISYEWFNRFPSELSGGELQRFCLARALSPNTKYLIADEMTTMLDAITQAQIWQSLLHLAEMRSIGILIISHHLHLLERICDRTLDFDELANEC